MYPGVKDPEQKVVRELKSPLTKVYSQWLKEKGKRKP